MNPFQYQQHLLNIIPTQYIPKKNSNNLPQFQKNYSQSGGFSSKIYMNKKSQNLSRNNNFNQIDVYSSSNSNSFSMILSSVLVGVYKVGDPVMKDPPLRNDGNQYDSTVDSLINPSIFVIYRDYRAYPNYIINYS